MKSLIGNVRALYNDRRNQTITVTVPADDEQAQMNLGFVMFERLYNIASSTKALQDDGALLCIDTYQRPYVDANGVCVCGKRHGKVVSGCVVCCR